MASLTLAGQESRWPSGTTVHAYLASAFPLGWKAADGLPAGAVSQGSAVVQADGSLTIPSLTSGVKYRLFAVVGSTPVTAQHYVNAPDPSLESGGTSGLLSARPGADTVPANYTYYATDTNELYFAIAGAWVLAPFSQQATTPSIEDLMANASYQGAAMPGGGASTVVPLLVAPFPLRVMSFQWTIEIPVAGLISSATNYFSLTMRKNSTNNVAFESLQSSARARRTGYNWDALAFDPTHKVLAKNDTLEMVFTGTGTPVGLERIAMTVRYEPI